MRCKTVILLAITAFAAVQAQAQAAILGSAQDFAVLGASTVTNTGPTSIWGDLGVDPGTAITGFPPGILTGGSMYEPGDVARQARKDALTAYLYLAELSSTTHYSSPADLGGLTLSPGVYKFDSSAQLTGTVTLNFGANPNANFVFQIGSTLTTASDSSVNVINGGRLSGVYWQVGSSATLGTSTMFAGNILADQSITLNSGADILCGRAIALNAAVTMDTNTISNNNTLQDFDSDRSDFGSYGFSGGAPIPEPSSFLVFGSLMGLFVLRRCTRRYRTRYCGSRG